MTSANEKLFKSKGIRSVVKTVGPFFTAAFSSFCLWEQNSVAALKSPSPGNGLINLFPLLSRLSDLVSLALP